MGRTISIRSLIKDRSSGQTTETETAHQLPPALLDSLPLWNGIAMRAGEVLSPLLGTEVTVGAELSVVTHEALRKSSEKPGLFLPLEPAASGAMVLLPNESAIDLSSLLLRAADSNLARPEIPEGLDAVLAREVTKALSDLLDDAFGLRLSLAPGNEGETRWPITAPVPGPKLMASFEIAPETGERSTVQVVFPDTEELHFKRVLGKSEKRLDVSRMTISLTATLARWQDDTVTLASLKPGSSIIVPGAQLDAVLIEADAMAGPRVVGSGTLGTSRGRRQIEIAVAG